ncbi:MAG: hypothetical protein COA54_08130 [Thiotrichaceae bacterium]|nr:MAG: hypothetical protein COA54_08130 [Thiotrichaceae bacterium]
MLVKKNIAERFYTGKSKLTYFGLIAVLLLVITSVMEDGVAIAGHQEGYDMINLSIGQVGILDSIDGSQRYGIEYRFKSIISPYGFDIVPAVGAAIADNGAHFIYLDFKHDIYLSEQWLLIPSFGLGVFKESKDINLGNDLEFRSGIEFSYQFYNKYRAGVALFHLSNGGISSLNPGTEVLVFSFSMPIPAN